MRRARVALAMLLACGCGLGVVGTASLNGDGREAGAPDERVVIDAGDALDARDAPEAQDVSITTIQAANALAFTAGANQYVDFVNIPLPADFTVEAWIRPASIGREMMIAAEDRTLNTSDQFRFAVLSTGELYLAMSDQSSNYFGLVDYKEAGPAQFALHSPSPLPTGVWSHVAVTKSGADFTLLVGATIVSTFTAASATFTRATDWSFRIGARMGSGGPDNYFDGTIDELRLYRRGRTVSEIASDMRTEVVASSPGYADLASYWRFDEDGGTTVHDDRKGFDGTLKNGARWVSSDAF